MKVGAGIPFWNWLLQSCLKLGCRLVDHEVPEGMKADLQGGFELTLMRTLASAQMAVGDLLWETVVCNHGFDACFLCHSDYNEIGTANHSVDTVNLSADSIRQC